MVPTDKMVDMDILVLLDLQTPLYKANESKLSSLIADRNFLSYFLFKTEGNTLGLLNRCFKKQQNLQKLSRQLKETLKYHSI